MAFGGGPMKILVVHGPNLNLLGEREPDIYGRTTLAELDAQLRNDAKRLGVDALRTFQSNHEGALVDAFQNARHWMDGAVFNPAAYTHTSVALRDVISAIRPPVIEVHLSDPKSREPFRQHSFVEDVCLKTFAGKGVESYREALAHLVDVLRSATAAPEEDR